MPRTLSVCAFLTLFAAAGSWAAESSPQTPSVPQPEMFGTVCAVCHGGDGSGTDRAPGLLNNRRLRTQSEGDIAGIIRNGRNNMPSFAGLPDEQIQALAAYVHSLNASAIDMNASGDAAAGSEIFFGSGQCVQCHTAEGRGGANGPDLSSIGRQLTLKDLTQAIDHPSSRVVNGYGRVRVTMRDGSTLQGFARDQATHALVLQTTDGRLHLLRDADYTSVVADTSTYAPAFSGNETQRRDLIAYLSRLGGITVGPNPAARESLSTETINTVLQPKPADWPSYNGRLDGNRYSELTNINTQNVAQLRSAWVHPLPYSPLETTPVVVDGVMYVTGPNQVYALDGRSGSEIWNYSRPRSSAEGISGDASKGANRGVAILGDHVFYITDNAHLICLHRLTGALLWEVDIPGRPGKYGGTSAPLVVNDLVVVGVSGGDEGIRGFVAAFKATSGEEAWRFWTVPAPGDPAMKTWTNTTDPQGGATWTTGSYDKETGMLFWATGNPYPDTDGDDRQGDNLYTNSDVALDAKTGKLKWYFQFTPHDLHDWDANQPIVLVDAPFQGRERKLLLHANRNGFFYVLDRTNGKFLQGTPLVKRLTWASGIDKNGRPIELPGNGTTEGGVKTCPAVRGATNWYSTAFSPVTQLYYVMTSEDCTIYRKAKNGGYAPVSDQSEPPMKVLRALAPDSGKVVWELPMKGSPEKNYSGVLAMKGGIVFFGETNGGFIAADAASGRVLWRYEGNQPIKGSPMTYEINGHQYIAIASGPNILSFSLPDESEQE
ncbi:MAG: PQQ-binding-like beta-propeller repeat protein [Povalibacter sp.]